MVRGAGLAYARETRARIPAPKPGVRALAPWRGRCTGCPYMPLCKALVKARLPVLCENLEAPEARALGEVFS